ncbi:hypothetical protein HNP84_004334 [Thermocatellispora tengchongensis]|uniref:PduH protein n=1 Tax=Thermocatellispora tengchongensis TaxID=1073253 RepID=A0A840P5I3_9ACTN|nr:glycerol dehydratase reactivase beta/small subunit family protein [Thermocatellispora tengchongensis]MBB5134602.1 hypothetical protein [Thermocatellispora tengchongensis]
MLSGDAGRERPEVLVRRSARAARPDVLHALAAGLEEEGVPFRVEEARGGAAYELAHAAALASRLRVGIGVDADGRVCVHHAQLPLSAPVAAGPPESARLLGHNAARLVTGIPLKPEPA